MLIRALGPLTVEERSLPPRERVALAALVAHRGRAVSGAELAEAIWGEDVPDTWWQQVKTSIARIRVVLGAPAIGTAGSAYRLDLDPGLIDVERFERLVASARRSSTLGEPEMAIARYREALALWRGEPFPELGRWERSSAEARRLEEIRAAVEEEILEVRLAAGEADPLVAEAEGLVSAEPYRERRWRLLALAAYRSGRQSDALTALRRARTALVDDLGIDAGAWLAELERQILTQDPALDAPAVSRVVEERCPYRGLEAFDSASADYFFGRDEDALAVLQRIRTGEITTIVGGSGTGKSSLLRAGAVPELLAGGRSVIDVAPSAGLVPQLRDAVALRSGASVVLIDQFEELFSTHGGELTDVVALLGQLLDAGASIVTTLRSDFLDDATSLPDIGAGVGRGVVALGRLREQDLRDAIERPAELAGLLIESGLVELILRDTGTGDAMLPMLSYALVETWRRREGRVLTVAGYQAAGGLAGAIAQSAEECYQGLDEPGREACRRLMLRLVGRVDGGSVVRRRLPLDGVLADATLIPVYSALLAARLVSIEADSLSVVHESIAAAWPRLTGWLDEAASSQRVARLVEEGARVWNETGRAEDDLLRGPRLAAALVWRDEDAPVLADAERDFLDASSARERSERVELEARVRRERRQNRRLRSALVGIGVVLVLALVAGGVAVVRGRDASAAEASARIEALAATSKQLVASDRPTAELLAVALYRRNPTDVRARAALLTAATDPTAPLDTVVYKSQERIFAGAIPGTTKLLVARSTIGASPTRMHLEIRDLAHQSDVRQLPADLPGDPTYNPGRIMFSPDGSTALLVYGAWVDGQRGDCCSSVRAVVDLTSGKVIEGPVSSSLWTQRSGIITADGRTAVLGLRGSREPVWVDVATLANSPVPEDIYPDGNGNPAAVAQARDGTVLVGSRGMLARYDPVTHARISTIRSAKDLEGNDLAVLPDGGVLTAGFDGVQRLDASGRVVWTVDPSPRVCDRMVLEMNGEYFDCLRSPTIWRSRLVDGMPVPESIDVQTDWAARILTLGDGTLAAINTRNVASILRFSPAGTGPIGRVVARGRAALDGFVDDHTLVTVARPSSQWDQVGTAVLWDTRRNRAVGAPAADMIALGGGRYVRIDHDGDRPVIRTLGSSRVIQLRGGVFDSAGDIEVQRGDSPERAFASSDEWITAFDPRTGRPVGKPLDFRGKALFDWAHHEASSPGSHDAVVTWWDAQRGTLITAVFDLTTGRELARGLYGAVQSALLPDGTVASVTSSELQHSTAQLAPIDAWAKPTSGAANFQISRDGSTLLLEGIGEKASLYDVASGDKLTTDLDTDAPFTDSAWLSRSGSTLATNVGDGVLLRDIRPASAAAALCRAAGRELTTSEWRRFFGDETQQKICS